MKVVPSNDLGEPWARPHLAPPTHSAPASSRTRHRGDSWLPAPPPPAPRHALPLRFPPLQMFGGRVFLQAQVSRCAAEGPVNRARGARWAWGWGWGRGSCSGLEGLGAP